MNKLGIFAATILAAAGACCGVEARAADAKTCTGLWDFIETDCQLTWYGITLYGVIDAGFTYQTHARRLIRAALRGPHTSCRDIADRRRGGTLHRTGCKIHSSASRGPSRSAETPLWSLPWMPASILIHSDPPVERDRPMPTPALPRTSKPRGRIPAEPASGTTAMAMSASVLRVSAP
jgi:hypothetical protein